MRMWAGMRVGMAKGLGMGLGMGMMRLDSEGQAMGTRRAVSREAGGRGLSLFQRRSGCVSGWRWHPGRENAAG